MFDDYWPVFAGFIALCFLGPLVFTVAVGLWEKHPLTVYAKVYEDEEYEPVPKSDAANADAEGLGYSYLGVRNSAAESKGVRVRYDFWLSDDRLTVACVGGGTLIKIPFHAVWLWSRLTDGTYLLSVNEVGQQILSPLVRQRTYPKATLDAMDLNHDKRLETHDAVPYSEDPFADGDALRKIITDDTVARGWATYTADGAAWKFTVRGVLRYYVVGVYVRPLRRLVRGCGADWDG